MIIKDNLRSIFLILTILLLLSIACGTSTPTEEPSTDQTSITNEKATDTLAPATTKPTETLIPTATYTSTPAVWLELKSNANIRTGPGTEYQPTAVMKAGERLPAYMVNSDKTWFLINTENYLWVNISVANIEGDINSLPAAPTPLPTSTHTATPTITPVPSTTPVPAMSLNLIYRNLEEMTALQFKEFKNSIVGKPVRENVTVGNVQDDGKVTISGPWSPILFKISEFCVVVAGVPKDLAISLDGGDEIFLDAKIDRIVDDYNYYNNCENTLVLVYQSIEKR